MAKDLKPSNCLCSKVVKPRRPFAMDPQLDYSVMEDEEWEPEPEGDSLSVSLAAQDLEFMSFLPSTQNRKSAKAADTSIVYSPCKEAYIDDPAPLAFFSIALTQPWLPMQ